MNHENIDQPAESDPKHARCEEHPPGYPIDHLPFDRTERSIAQL